MSLLDEALGDAKDIVEHPDGYTALILITSPEGVVYGTLDPLDVANHIYGWIGDHYTQYDADAGMPQPALNAKVTITLETLLEQGITGTVIKPDLVNWQWAWLDPTSGERRDFKTDRIHPTRSLGVCVIILGELDIEPAP